MGILLVLLLVIELCGSRTRDEHDDEDEFETGPRGRSCTCNLPVLSGTPLAIWATRGFDIYDSRFTIYAAAVEPTVSLNSETPS